MPMQQPETATLPEQEEFRIWRRPFHSLPTRLGFFVLAATLCTSLIITAIALNSIDSFLRAGIEESFPAMLKRTDIEIDSWYEDHQAIAADFAQGLVQVGHLQDLVGKVHGRDLERSRRVVGRQLQLMLDETPAFSSAFVLDRNGETLAWRGREIELSMGMREEISHKSLSRAGYSEGAYYQVISIPLEGSIGAKLHLAFELEELATVLKIHGAGLNGSTSIVGPDQHYLATSSGKPAPSKYRLPLPAEGATTKALETTGAEGQRLISSAISLGRHGWSLVIEEEYDLAFARVVSATRRVLGINLAIVAVFALFAYRFAVGLVRPIEALSQAAKLISRGEKDVQIPHSASPDEVGLLTRAFSEMTSRINSNAREIEAANRSVEEVNAELRTRNDELHRANEVLAQLSITDGLTQLHNHRYFQDALAKEAKRADRTEEPLSLILIDIDHFKKWNDRLGHAAGDEILRRIAEVMNTLLRGTDLLARYGGEEFALMAPGTSLEGAVQLAEKIRGTIAETRFLIDPPSEHQNVTVSMGVSLYDGDRKRLFSEADQALYRAKDTGRDCVIAFEPERAG